MYSHLSNKRVGWNKRGGGAKVGKSLNREVGINVEGGFFFKISKRDFTFIREMRVHTFSSMSPHAYTDALM